MREDIVITLDTVVLIWMKMIFQWKLCRMTSICTPPNINCHVMSCLGKPPLHPFSHNVIYGWSLKDVGIMLKYGNMMVLMGLWEYVKIWRLTTIGGVGVRHTSKMYDVIYVWSLKGTRLFFLFMYNIVQIVFNYFRK